MSSVWYIGSSAVRAISGPAWAQAGFPGMDERVWSEGNGWSIPQSAFTAGQLTYLGLQSEFQLTEDDGPRPTGQGYIPPDETPATRGWVEAELADLASTITAGGGYVWHQTSSAATWIVSHTFSRTPNVQVLDDFNQVIEPDVVHSNPDTVVVIFAHPSTGTVILT